MALKHSSMLNNGLLNKDPYLILEQAFLIILDGKSAIRMDNNGKVTKNIRYISRIINLVINVDE